MMISDTQDLHTDTATWLHLEEAAAEHIHQLIAQESVPDMAIRMQVEGLMGPAPEVVIAFCPPGQESRQDILWQAAGIRFFIAAEAYPFLKEASIGYEESPMGGQLVVRAPHLKAARPAPGPEAPLAERIEWVLDTEVRPQLALHHGEVHVREITPDFRVILHFAGGCKGCRMVDYTLKYGVEQKIQHYCPQVRAVVDSTNHSEGDKPYYG